MATSAGAANAASPDTDLYGLLHVSRDATDEEIRKAYRSIAQIYHPDKYQSPQMQDVAKEQFNRVRDAYEILSDEGRRQVYDIYGLEGLKSGLEIGERLKTKEEIREEFERAQIRQSERRLRSRLHQTGTMAMTIGLNELWESRESQRGFGVQAAGQRDGLGLKQPKAWVPITDMALQSTVQAPLSDKNVLVLGGNLATRKGLGGGNAVLVFKRQCSSYSSWEVVTTAGLRSSIGLQVNRHERSALNGDIRLGTSSFGLSASYSRHFSAVSQGRVSGKLGSSGVEVEIGGTRRISDNSTAGMSCAIGLQGILWKLRYTRGGQRFVLPMLLSSTLNPYFALGAVVIPCSLYIVLKTYLLKPYAAKRKQRRLVTSRKENAAKVREVRKSARGAQTLMENVAKRKRSKEEDRQGLVILEAIYGNLKEWKKDPDREVDEDDEETIPPPWLDVTMPAQFLVDNNGELQFDEGLFGLVP
ncbi:hypothetical protein CBR_g27963 [Chara braunii]|uniref:J domain-containing protein n=1 Tax=Chara braunii TaxID=69332 RepID=A0A388L8U6_CHABU|nr:hypothetical protein CBR_g27963 [Chara braunii]|eukprot:GBG78739.1 hypothetical protein CBR_g27963 [Chara braunii]